MKTDFIFIGDQESLQKQACAKYLKKLETLTQVQLKLIPASKIADIGKRKKEETLSLLKAAGKADRLVICDEKGQTFSSTSFSSKLFQNASNHYVFCIGGAYGFDLDEIPSSALKLKLSDFVLSHEIAQLLLLEQVYRALTIQKKMPYHHV